MQAETDARAMGVRGGLVAWVAWGEGALGGQLCGVIAAQVPS
ncbi:putative protein without homology [Propionibacterium freudenreichii subsp. shermanii]|nr:putative protein without homology [Propionibacterium freudenreichii subsp. shermanii]